MRGKKRQKLRSRVKKKSDTREKTAKTLHGRGQKAQTESASRVRNRKKRQKLRSGVKFRSGARENAAESLQRSKETVGYTRKNGRKFTAV